MHLFTAKYSKWHYIKKLTYPHRSIFNDIVTNTILLQHKKTKYNE